MRVEMDGGLRRQLADYCRSVYPSEACGFIIGDIGSGSGVMSAKGFVPVRNVSPSPEREFHMDPAELIALMTETPQGRLLGIFHSHPRTAPVPSAADLQTAWYTLPSYWIVSLMNTAAPSIAVYRLERRGETIVPVPLLTQHKEDSYTESSFNDDGSSARTDRLTYRSGAPSSPP
jgi:proteasome lid subunit RPN8/RPN11